MGHLFSRAFRRLTQCSQSRSQTQEQTTHSHQPVEQQDKRDDHTLEPQTNQLVSQSINVGQSIDSDEYADVFPPQADKRTADSSDARTTTTTTTTTSATPTTAPTTPPIDAQPDVEGAVIKIQALVRGHLTRKALKDAHQQSNPNALGQSQFDEESLTRNPAPTAVFLSSTPLSLDNYQQSPATKTIEARERTPLESISEAEADEVMGFQLQDEQSAQIDHRQAQKETQKSNDDHENDDVRIKSGLSESRLSSTPSKLEMPPSGRESTSPVPSEADASIDLNCDTPNSVSIDILDHNMKPIDQMASVLHHRLEENPEVSDGHASQVEVNYSKQHDEFVDRSSSPLDSEEAAAIRIQSAFRGYRTRKNSPYRSRSLNPNASFTANGTNKQVEQQLLDGPELLLTPEEELEANTNALTEGRRSSRPRRRNSSPQAIDEPSPASIGQQATAKASQPTTDIATTDDTSTVCEDLTQQAGVIRETISEDVDISLNEQVDALCSSLESTNATENQSAALEVESTATDGNQAVSDGSVPIDRHANQRNSALQQRQSDASVETDSSVLGAALSLNEESSELALESQGVLAQVALEPIEENGDVMLNTSDTDELLELETQRLIEDMNKAADYNGCALEADEPADDSPQSILDDEQQRAIELESDDIERRDPSGQVSEERSSSKSPQIRTEELRFSSQNNEPDQRKLVEDKTRLAVEKDQDLLSGRPSSTASSAGPSTSNEASEDSGDCDSRGDNSDHEAKQGADVSTGKEQLVKKQGQQQPKGKSKKNRNKKRGKK